MKKVFVCLCTLCFICSCSEIKKSVGELKQMIAPQEEVKTATDKTPKEKPKYVPPKDSKHLSFKGVPIDGSLREYVERMTDAGFTHEGTSDGTAMLTGDFAGRQNCTIYVSTLDNVDLVSNISVCFPSFSKWDLLESDYNDLKRMLTEKYGKPSKVVEKFQYKFFPPEDNREKYHELYMDRCIWETRFNLAKGNILLSIEYNKEGFVLLRYYDKINTDKVRSAAMNDL